MILCQECSASQKALQRISKAQNCSAQLEHLRTDNDKCHTALVKAFAKEREDARRIGRRIHFQVMSFVTEWVSTAGVRKEEVGEMMWEGEWLEESKKAKHGFMSRSEAESKWKSWVQDPLVPKDSEGPHQCLRCWVKTKDQLGRYEDMGNTKRFRQEEKINKNASQEVLQHRMRAAMGMDTGIDAPCSDMAGIQDKAWLAMGSSNHALSGDGILGPDVSSLIKTAKRKRGVEQEEESQEDEGGPTDEESGDEEKEGGEGAENAASAGGKPSGQAGSWFDAETKCPEAERSHLRSLDKHHKDLSKIFSDMSLVLAEFRASPADAKASLSVSLPLKSGLWGRLIV